MNEHLEKALAALQAAREGQDSPDTLLEIARTQASIATAELLQTIVDNHGWQ